MFDAASGRIRSLDEKQTITVRDQNTSVDVPTTVSLHLLTATETKQAVADDAAADAKGRAMLEAMVQRDRAKQERTDRLNAATRTALVGGNGGLPFAKTGTGAAPVLGIRYKLGEWGGKVCVRQLDPIYDRGNVAGPDAVLMARDGYAVGGLEVPVNGTDLYGGIRIVFFRLRNGRLDPTDRYVSEQVGLAGEGESTKVIESDGRPVTGLFGRQGMNLDAIGLVMPQK